MDQPQESGRQRGQCAKKENLIRENSENREETKAKVVIKSFRGTSWRKSSGMAGNNSVCTANNFPIMFSKKRFSLLISTKYSKTEL